MNIQEKKEIMNSWNLYFPELKPIGKNKLLRIIGPVIYGIELIFVTNMGWYKPHVVMYPLWGNKFGNDIKNVFLGPILNYIFCNDKNLNISVPYTKHHLMLDEIMKFNYINNLVVSFDYVRFEDISKFINEHPSHNTFRVDLLSFVKTLELEFTLGLYINNIQIMEHTIEKMNLSAKKWNMSFFERVFGNYDLWINSLKNRVNEKNHFIDIIEKNKKEKLLKNLNFSELIA